MNLKLGCGQSLRYDMSGSLFEYVMGVLEYDAQGEVEHSGQIVAGSSGFKGLSESGSSTTGSYDLPNEKYYNKYKSADPTSGWLLTKPESACNGGKCYGHVLSETSSWYSDYARFVNRSNPWFLRGGRFYDSTGAGIFNTDYYNGNSSNNASCRLTLIS